MEYRGIILSKNIEHDTQDRLTERFGRNLKSGTRIDGGVGANFGKGNSKHKTFILLEKNCTGGAQLAS